MKSTNRGLIVFLQGSLVSAYIGLILTTPALTSHVQSNSHEKTYTRACTQLAKAQTLHFKMQDGVSQIDSEYWLAKPNKFKVVYSNGKRIYCNGKTILTISEKGQRMSAQARGSFPDEIQQMDFRSFFRSRPILFELMGGATFEFRNKKHPAQWLKTTESAIEYGQAFLNPGTMLPLGHHTTLQSEVETDLYYPLVEVDLVLKAEDFREGARHTGKMKK